MPAPASPSTDNALAAIIRNVESGCRLSAIRYEPGIFASLAQAESNAPLIQKIAGINACDIETAKIIFSTSYGLWQEMGFNIYSLGYDLPILQFWQSQTDQRRIYDAFIVKNGVNFSWSEMLTDQTKMEEFARVYNGPADIPEYIAAMHREAIVVRA